MSSYFEPTPLVSGIAVQYGTIAVTLNSVSNTATITAVDVARSFVVYLGSSTTETNPPRPNVDVCRLTLTNSTTVTATRNASAATPDTVNFVVVSFSSSFVSSVQAGSITIANNTASNTATITSINIAKTVLFWTGQETGEATFGRSAFARLDLTNATTVTATRDAATEASTITVGFVAVTFV